MRFGRGRWPRRFLDPFTYVGFVMAKAEKEESMVEAYVRVQAEIVCALENLQEWAGSLPAPDEDGKLPAAINWGDVGSMGEVKRLLGQALSFIHNVEE